MRICSTRDRAQSVSLSQAMQQGLAPDGGLFVPAELPRIGLPRDGVTTLAGTARTLLAPFFEGDALAPRVPEIVTEAFTFPAPLRRVQGDPERLSVLELFHGPTAAFKDFGARFLAACLARIPGDGRPLTILVATSGDTGGAVAAAFHGRPGVEVVVLYPAGLVSPLQERQLTCWGGNVRSFAVRGSFDDCQRMVKQAFADPELRARLRLNSANSINIGRLLPQLCYLGATALRVWESEGRAPGFLVPSGNLGQAVACVWARAIGLPIGEIVLVHNANRTVPDFLADGQWRPRPSIATLASAMDVGDPSNMERLRFLFPDAAGMAGSLRAVSVSDTQIRESIRAEYAQTGLVLCPHSATAVHVYRNLDPEVRRETHWVAVATAHAAKFAEIVAPLIGGTLAMPPALAELAARPVAHEDLPADFAALRARLGSA